MTIKMPSWQVGRNYRREEVGDHIGYQEGTSNFDLVGQRLRPELDIANLGEEMLLQYHEYPMADFEEQVQALKDSYAAANPERRRRREQQRVQQIVKVLCAGEQVFPVFISLRDHDRTIIEGRHLAVALQQLGSSVLPAWLAGFESWFNTEDIA